VRPLRGGKCDVVPDYVYEGNCSNSAPRVPGDVFPDDIAAGEYDYSCSVTEKGVVNGYPTEGLCDDGNLKGDCKWAEEEGYIAVLIRRAREKFPAQAIPACTNGGSCKKEFEISKCYYVDFRRNDKNFCSLMIEVWIVSQGIKSFYYFIGLLNYDF
jgi:hypothetical protein